MGMQRLLLEGLFLPAFPSPGASRMGKVWIFPSPVRGDEIPARIWGPCHPQGFPLVPFFGGMLLCAPRAVDLGSLQAPRVSFVPVFGFGEGTAFPTWEFPAAPERTDDSAY